MKKIIYLFVWVFLISAVAKAQCGLLNSDIRIYDANNLQGNLIINHANYANASLSKYDILKKFTDVASGGSGQFSDKLAYTIETFVKLVEDIDNLGAGPTGLRVYFVALSKVNGPEDAYTTNRLNQIVPVWVPTKYNATTKEDYNVLAPDNKPYCFFFTPQNSVVRLSHETVSAWRDNYEKLWKELNIHIGKEMPADPLSKQDTKSIWYKWNDIAELAKFLKCNVNSGNVADKSFNLQFACYDNYASRRFITYQLPNVTKKVSRQLTMLMNVPGVEMDAISAAVNKVQKKNALSPNGIKKNNQYAATIDGIQKDNNKSTSDKQKILKEAMLKFLKAMPAPPGGDFDTALPCPPATTCIGLEP